MSKMFSKWFGGNDSGKRSKSSNKNNICNEPCCTERRRRGRHQDNGNYSPGKSENGALENNMSDHLNSAQSDMIGNGKIGLKLKRDQLDGKKFSKVCPGSNRDQEVSSDSSSDNFAIGTSQSENSREGISNPINDFMGYYEPQSRVATGMPVQRDSAHYNMDHLHRGHAIIFNFDKWDNTSVPSLDLKPRQGSRKDRDDLSMCLQRLDFDVHIYNNLDANQFWKVLKNVRHGDHRDNDCLVVAIMTHGEKNHIYVKDGTLIPVNLVWEFFEADKCPSLAGKPKIFLIQACRGKNYDHGTQLYSSQEIPSPIARDVTDSANFSYVIPNAADIIVAFSCPLGHYSWRHPEEGSWFIQAICKVLNEHAYNIDLQGCLTTVAREVALNKESSTDNPAHNKKKQVTSTSSTLIRIVQFKPKPKSQLQLGSIISSNPNTIPVVVRNRIDTVALEQVPSIAVPPPLVPASSSGASFNQVFQNDVVLH